MNNLFMIISILGGLSSLTLTVVLITSLFVKRLKPRRKKFTIALVTSVILCVVGGALYEISPEDKARMAQEAEAKKVAKAQAKKEAEAKEKSDKEEQTKAKEQAKKAAEEKKAQEESKKKEEEEKRKAEQEEADRIKAEEKAQKEAEKSEWEAQKMAEEEEKKAETEAKKKADEEEAKRLKAEKEAKTKEEQEQKAQAKKEKEERDKKEGTKVKIERYDTCNSQGKYCDRGGFHDGAFDALKIGMNPEEVTLKLNRNAQGASIEYIKDKSGNYVEVIQYHFESAWYFLDASFKDGKLYYAERNEIKASKDKKEEHRILDGSE
ncbi:MULTISPECIES: cell division protein MukB [Bacillus cereus group]|uniref:cell division protein MukB n=1 Tax=Bacillus cereus group TaxID=86661 RepID=UPI000B333B48|nr:MULTISPECIES: cell division protein MukB [Bacillus cereus group]